MDKELEETLAIWMLSLGLVLRGRRLPNGLIEMEPDYVATLAIKQRGP